MKGVYASPPYLSKVQFNFEQMKQQISLNVKVELKEKGKERAMGSTKNLSLDQDGFSDANLVIDRTLLPKKIYVNKKRIPIYQKEKKSIDKSESEIFYNKINLKKRNKTELKQQISTMILKNNPQSNAVKEFKPFHINHFKILQKREPLTFTKQQKDDSLIKNNYKSLTPNIHALRNQAKSHREVLRLTKKSHFSMKSNMLPQLLHSNRDQCVQTFEKYRQFILQKSNDLVLKQQQDVKKPKAVERSTTEVNGWDDVDIFNSNKNGIIEYASKQA